MEAIELPIRRSVGIIIDFGEEWILQIRDSKDGILWPGKVSLWGGAMEPEDGSNFFRSALRELQEELELSSEEVELAPFGEIHVPHQGVNGEVVQLHAKLFAARLRRPRALHAYEGKGIFRMRKSDFPNGLGEVDFAPLTYEALELAQGMEQRA